METLRLLSTTQQVDPALFGEEYSDYIDVTEESPFKDYNPIPKTKGITLYQCQYNRGRYTAPKEWLYCACI